jgi:hypothetical protein
VGYFKQSFGKNSPTKLPYFLILLLRNDLPNNAQNIDYEPLIANCFAAKRYFHS